MIYHQMSWLYLRKSRRNYVAEKTNFNTILSNILFGITSVIWVALSVGAAMWAIRFAATQIMKLRGM